MIPENDVRRYDFTVDPVIGAQLNLLESGFAFFTRYFLGSGILARFLFCGIFGIIVDIANLNMMKPCTGGSKKTDCITQHQAPVINHF
jgi:hypothetical protein